MQPRTPWVSHHHSSISPSGELENPFTPREIPLAPVFPAVQFLYGLSGVVHWAVEAS